jgi:uncharacterized damage-inducible protein DinB
VFYPLSLRALKLLAFAAIAAGAAVPGALSGQQPQGSADAAFDAKAAAHVRAAYLADLDTLHAKFMALANAIPAEKYSWRPGTGVRSISEVFMHIAGEWYHWAPASIGRKAPADFPTDRAQLMAKLDGLEKTTTKNEVIAELNKSWTHCRAQFVATDPATLTGKYKPWGMTVDAAAFSMAGDLHEHLGQLIAYSRSVGVKPPWSK